MPTLEIADPVAPPIVTTFEPLTALWAILDHLEELAESCQGCPPETISELIAARNRLVMLARLSAFTRH